MAQTHRHQTDIATYRFRDSVKVGSFFIWLFVLLVVVYAVVILVVIINIIIIIIINIIIIVRSIQQEVSIQQNSKSRI